MRQHFTDNAGAEYPIAYALNSEETVRALLTHSDYDPVQKTSICGAVASLLALRCGVQSAQGHQQREYGPFRLFCR